MIVPSSIEVWLAAYNAKLGDGLAPVVAAAAADQALEQFEKRWLASSESRVQRLDDLVEDLRKLVTVHGKDGMEKYYLLKALDYISRIRLEWTR